MGQLSVVPLPSGHLQVFYKGQSMWQTAGTTNPAAFTELSPFGGANFIGAAACTELDTIPVVWGFEGNDLYSSGKESLIAGAVWTNPAIVTFQLPLSADVQCLGLAAGKSVPGRIQLFAICGDASAEVNEPSGVLWTCWQDDADQPAYNPWEAMPSPNNRPIVAIGAHNVPNGRLQLWVITGNNFQLMTQWKEARERNAPWSGWVAATTQPHTVLAVGSGYGGSLDDVPSGVVGGIRQDGDVQIWCTVGPGNGGHRDCHPTRCWYSHQCHCGVDVVESAGKPDSIPHRL
jgi:hypothetical protein